MHSCPCAKSFPVGEERIEDNTFVYFPHKIGRSTLVCGRRSSHFPYQIFVGPEWPCMFVTFGMIIVPTVFFLMNVAYLLHPAAVVIGTVTCALTLWFYTCTACSDPGIVFLTPVGGNSTHSENGDDIVGVARGDPGCDVGCSPGSECSEGGETKKKRVHIRRDSSPGVGVGNGASASLVGRMECGQCHVSRPVTAAHCYECGVCVDELDHHCPWTGKCIAKKNLHNFRMFLVFLCMHILYVLAVCIYTAVTRIEIYSSSASLAK